MEIKSLERLKLWNLCYGVEFELSCCEVMQLCPKPVLNRRQRQNPVINASIFRRMVMVSILWFGKVITLTARLHSPAYRFEGEAQKVQTTYD